jgi:hypothetical protein
MADRNRDKQMDLKKTIKDAFKKKKKKRAGKSISEQIRFGEDSATKALKDFFKK